LLEETASTHAIDIVVVLVYDPAPLLFKFILEICDTPTSFFCDPVKDLQDLFLFAPDGEVFSGNSETADGSGCDAAAVCQLNWLKEHSLLTDP
jgi:hypothetical protein